MRLSVPLAVAGTLLLPVHVSAQQHCGGIERWAVKVLADPGASQVDVQHPVPTSFDDLVHLPRPTVPSDQVTRTTDEQSVRTVTGWLLTFKHETGKSGDGDFHLVITDATLESTHSGAGWPESPHSFVAEIPDPNCVSGADGTIAGPSLVQARLDTVRAKFLRQFPHITSGWNAIDPVRVRLTGVVFFDRPHGQRGRSLHGLELHPLLDIEFNPAPGVVPSPPTTKVALANPGFEDGDQGWDASPKVITEDAEEPAHDGQWKAWLGGYGEKHTDRLSQRVDLPDTAQAIALTFFLHINTEEDNSKAYDKMYVRLRDASGRFLKTLKTYTNQNAAPGFHQQSLALDAYKGQTVRIEFVSSEDSGSATSFVIDDVAVVSVGQ